jgi:hypothetical protein
MPGVGLTVPLPMITPLAISPDERAIERTASQTLVTSYAFAGKTIRARIKTLQALDAFYATAAALYTRNHVATTAAIAALSAGTGTGAGNGITTRKTPAVGTKTTKTSKAKVRGAGA